MQTGKKLSSFGRVGRYPGAVRPGARHRGRSKSNVYIAENRGRKIQRFKPVTQIEARSFSAHPRLGDSAEPGVLSISGTNRCDGRPREGGDP